ncbi:hypothetical protein OG369_04440 [Streptomyces sp. NBC_01221]|nr:hypothetical protein [Streptomyces sp. NBC_01221]MCX4785450.1 hypothetical protein [Streptomyces sp. NBC_01221]
MTQTRLSRQIRRSEPPPNAADVRVKYKETARGGLAVNIIEC